MVARKLTARKSKSGRNKQLHVLIMELFGRGQQIAKASDRAKNLVLLSIMNYNKNPERPQREVFKE